MLERYEGGVREWGLLGGSGAPPCGLGHLGRTWVASICTAGAESPHTVLALRPLRATQGSEAARGWACLAASPGDLCPGWDSEQG